MTGHSHIIWINMCHLYFWRNKSAIYTWLFVSTWLHLPKNPTENHNGKLWKCLHENNLHAFKLPKQQGHTSMNCIQVQNGIRGVWCTKSLAEMKQPIILSVVYPTIYRALYVTGGTGFLPSTLIIFCTANTLPSMFKHLRKLGGPPNPAAKQQKTGGMSEWRTGCARVAINGDVFSIVGVWDIPNWTIC